MLSVLSPGAGCGSAVYTHSPSHGAGGQMMILLGHEDTGVHLSTRKAVTHLAPFLGKGIGISLYLHTYI